MLSIFQKFSVIYQAKSFSLKNHWCFLIGISKINDLSQNHFSVGTSFLRVFFLNLHIFCWTMLLIWLHDFTDSWLLIKSLLINWLLLLWLLLLNFFQTETLPTFLSYLLLQSSKLEYSSQLPSFFYICTLQLYGHSNFFPHIPQTVVFFFLSSAIIIIKFFLTKHTMFVTKVCRYSSVWNKIAGMICSCIIAFLINLWRFK